MVNFKTHIKYLLVILLVWGLAWIITFTKLVEWRQDGLYVGYEHMWSDWPLHIGISNMFAFNNPRYWLKYHPMFAGGKFTYPFVADMISGLLMRIHVPILTALVVPQIVAAIFVCVLMYAFYYLWLGSPKKAVVSISLFFLSGGLGFIRYFKERFPLPPLKDYTGLPGYEWYSGNTIVGLLIPQKGFLWGLMLGLLAIVLLLLVLTKEFRRGREILLMILGGIVAGILPIVHVHSFLAVIAISAGLCLGNIKQWRKWIMYLLAAGLVSGVAYLTFIFGGVQISHFWQWSPGWIANKSGWEWISFWIRVWGLALPLAGVGLWQLRTKFQLWGLAVSFWVIWLAGNLFLFQPIAWDNAKLFLWSYLGFAGMISSFLLSLQNKLLWGVLFVILTISGALSFAWVYKSSLTPLRIISTEEIALAETVRNKTGPMDIFLTSPDHNHFIMTWAARPILMGFTGWINNFGFDYSIRGRNIEEMYKGGKIAEHLLRKYKISYVVIGPSELNNFKVNTSYFESKYALVFSSGVYKIFDVRGGH